MPEGYTGVPNKNRAPFTTMKSPTPKAHVTVGATDTVVLAANSSRSHAVIKASADNTEPIFLGFGSASQVDYGFSLDPGETFQIGPDNYYIGEISAISSSGGQVAEPFEA